MEVLTIQKEMINIGTDNGQSVEVEIPGSERFGIEGGRIPAGITRYIYAVFMLLGHVKVC